MGSQQGARPTYIPLVPSPLCSCPSLPITPLHPRLIWQQRWRRAGVRVTEGRCSSSNITLIRLFPRLVTLPSLLSLSSRSLLCLSNWLPPSSSVFLTQSLQPRWCKTHCHFYYVLYFVLFFSVWTGNHQLSRFFLLHLNIFKIWKYLWDYHQDKPSLICRSQCDTFTWVWISALMSDTLKPRPLPYFHFVCASDHLSPELVKSHFPNVCQERGEKYKCCIYLKLGKTKYLFVEKRRTHRQINGTNDN